MRELATDAQPAMFAELKAERDEAERDLAAEALVRDVRPVLCDVMKLASDLGQPEDYDKVAALVDRLDAWLEGR